MGMTDTIKNIFSKVEAEETAAATESKLEAEIRSMSPELRELLKGVVSPEGATTEQQQPSNCQQQRSRLTWKSL